MIEAVIRRIGIIPKVQIYTPELYGASYTGITTDQLRSINFQDQYLSSYSINVSGFGDFQYHMTLSKKRLADTPLETPTIDFVRALPSTEESLLKFVNATVKLLDASRTKGRLAWGLESYSGGYATAYIRINPQLDKPKAFSTNSDVANFIDELPDFGLKHPNLGIAYFENLTIDELQRCNLPKTLWPRNVINLKTHTS